MKRRLSKQKRRTSVSTIKWQKVIWKVMSQLSYRKWELKDWRHFGRVYIWKLHRKKQGHSRKRRQSSWYTLVLNILEHSFIISWFFSEICLISAYFVPHLTPLTSNLRQYLMTCLISQCSCVCQHHLLLGSLFQPLSPRITSLGTAQWLQWWPGDLPLEHHSTLKKKKKALDNILISTPLISYNHPKIEICMNRASLS